MEALGELVTTGSIVVVNTGSVVEVSIEVEDCGSIVVSVAVGSIVAAVGSSVEAVGSAVLGVGSIVAAVGSMVSVGSSVVGRLVVNTVRDLHKLFLNVPELVILVSSSVFSHNLFVVASAL